MTAIEYKTEFSMWAIAASPLVVTTPIMNCTSPPAPPVTSCKVQLVNKVRILIYLSSLTACDPKGRRIGYLRAYAVAGGEAGCCECCSSGCLASQTSDSACVANVSFGCVSENASMWTSDGCRGKFTCNGFATDCDVDGEGKHSCPCNGGGSVTCKATMSDLQKEILFNDDVRSLPSWSKRVPCLRHTDDTLLPQPPPPPYASSSMSQIRRT